MTIPPSSGDSDIPSHQASDLPIRGLGAGTPRWVKLFGVIALTMVLLLLIIIMLAIGGDHGPRRHMPTGGIGSDLEAMRPGALQ